MNLIDKILIKNGSYIHREENKAAMKEYSILEAKKILRRILRHSNNDLISISTRIIFEIELLKEKSK